MAQEPITVQLRYLQTLLEIGSNNNSTIVFPLPMEILRAFTGQAYTPEVSPPPPAAMPVIPEPEIEPFEGDTAADT